MKVIYDLIHIFHRHKVDLSPLWKYDPGRPDAQQAGLVGQFIQAVWEREGLTEEQIIQLLYGCPDRSPAVKFRKLKERVISILGSHVLTLDQTAANLTKTQRTYYAAHRELIVAKILEGRGGKVAARHFYLKSARKAKAVDVNLVGVAANQALRYYASRFQRDEKNFNTYDGRFRDSLAALKAEHEATRYYSKVVLAYGTSPKARLKVRTMAGGFVAALDAQYDVQEFGPSYAHPYYLLRLTAEGTADGHHRLLPVVNEAAKFFTQYKIQYSTALVSFLLTKFTLYIVANQFNEAENTRTELVKLVEPGTTQWIKLQELTVQFHLYAGQTALACQTYIKATSALKGNGICCSQQSKDRWATIRMYLYLPSIVDATQPFPEPDPLGTSFRMRRAINNIVRLDKEKSGRNLAVLFVELLFLLFNRQYRQFEGRLINAEQYMNRHVKGPEQLRSKSFFKILLRLPRVNYQLKEFEQKTRQLHSQLNQQPIALIGQSFEIEIVPYERLYMLVTEHLSQAKYV